MLINEVMNIFEAFTTNVVAVGNLMGTSVGIRKGISVVPDVIIYSPDDATRLIEAETANFVKIKKNIVNKIITAERRQFINDDYQDTFQQLLNQYNITENDLNNFGQDLYYSYDIGDRMKPSQIKQFIQRFPQLVSKKVDNVSISKIKTYLESDLGLDSGKTKKIFGDREIEHDEDSVVSIGKAQLVKSESMKEDVAQRWVKALTQANQLMTSKGLGDWFTGNIIFDKLGKGVAGLYMRNTKDLRIHPTNPSNNDVVEVVIHELAHKYMYEQMSDTDIKAVNLEYRRIGNSGTRFVPNEEAVARAEKKKGQWDDNSDIKVGDKLYYQKVGKIPGIKVKKSEAKYLEVKEIKPNLVVYKIQPLSDNAGSDYTVTTAKPLAEPNFSRTEKMKPAEVDEGSRYSDTTEFPSKYSMTSSSEWFAECIAAYCVDKLNQNAVDFYKSLNII